MNGGWIIGGSLPFIVRSSRDSTFLSCLASQRLDLGGGGGEGSEVDLLEAILSLN